jgi:FixJ family two-component response regulator
LWRGLVESVNLNVETFSSAEEFLKAYKPARKGCLVLDVRLPGMSGLQLQQRLREMHYSIPVIIVTGFGDVRMAVDALEAGAVSFLQKPVSDQLLLDTIRQAIEQDLHDRQEQARGAEIRARLAQLTPRQRQVMELLAAGNMSKEIAAKLRLSPKTVEYHRGHVMKKLRAETVADLVRFAVQAERLKE